MHPICSSFFQIISGAALLISSLSGMKAVAQSSEEVRKPSRNIPIAHTLSSMICSIALFILSAFVTLSVPANTLQYRAPMLHMFDALRVRNAKYFVGVGVTSGLLLVIVVQFQYAERLIFSVARDRLFPAMYEALRKNVEFFQIDWPAIRKINSSQSINQSNDQTNKQSIEKSIDQSINQSMKQSSNRMIYQ